MKRVDGAQLWIPFQCKLCWFRNIEGPGRDKTYLTCIRQANIDVMQGKSPWPPVLVGNQIGGWNNWWTIKSYEKLWLVHICFYLSCCCWWWHYCHNSLLASLRKKIGNPRKKIRNLNGFKYRYLNVLKVKYIVCILHCPKRVHLWAWHSSPLLLLWLLVTN